jgi:hypothetical protein
MRKTISAVRRASKPTNVDSSNRLDGASFPTANSSFYLANTRTQTFSESNTIVCELHSLRLRDKHH